MRKTSLYVGVLGVASLAALGIVLSRSPLSAASLLEIAAFAALLAVAERIGVLFHREDGRVGLSLAEAVVLPMLTALGVSEVVVGVALAWLIITLQDRRLGITKGVFNVAAAACAGFVAVTVTHSIAAGSTVVVADLGAAAVGTLLYAVLTHVLVAGAIALSDPDVSFRSAVTNVPRAVAINLAGGILVGLHFAAAYRATPWAFAMFPVALLVISLGYRAVVRQEQDRRRLANLHEASRALTSPILDEAITGFLSYTSDMASAAGAIAYVEVDGMLFEWKVYAGDIVSERVAVDPAAAGAIVRAVRGADASFIKADVTENDAGAAIRHRDLLGVPVRQEDNTIGCLVVVDRVGAEPFGAAETNLLEALANELSLALGSRRLSDEISRHRERFRALVEAVSDYAIYMLDPDGRIVSWNTGAERIFGYRAEEVVGETFSIFYPPEEGDPVRAELPAALANGRVTVEGWRVRRDGTRFLASGVVTPVFGPNGELSGFAKVTRDITDLVRAQEEKESLEAQLHQAQRLESVGQLAGGVAHDFNNILAVIRHSAGFVLQGLEGLDLGDEAKVLFEDVEEIKSASDRAAALTRQLLAFSRRDPVKPQVLDLNQVIEGLHGLLRRAVGQNVTVSLDLNDVGKVLADEGQIEQILMNLAVNARDAMDGAGRISIRTRDLLIDSTVARLFVGVQPGRFTEVTVADTGGGMPPAVVEKAFDPFFTTKPKGKGTGLGLATVYGIVKRWGGHIQINSEEGVGTTFVILFPVEDAADPRDDPGADAPDAGHGETILLVEDEDAVRKVLRRVLSQGGYTVVEAANGQAAIEEARRTSVDVVLSDIVMPGMSGFDVAEAVADVRPGAKLVLMSGYSEALTMPGAFDGTAAVLSKPFDRNALLGTIAEVLAR